MTVQRNLVSFSVRTLAGRSVREVAAELGGVLGCEFREGDVDRVPGMVGTVFGMTITVQPWTGRDDALLYRVRGEVIDPRFLDGSETIPSFETTDISPYVLDLLEVTTKQLWFIPSPEDRAAEQEFGRRLDEAYDS